MRRQVQLLDRQVVKLAAEETQAEELALAQTRLDGSLAEYQKVLDEIRATNPRLADLVRPQTLTLAEIRPLLDADTALLEFALGQDESFVWLRQLMEWQRDLKDSKEFLDTLRVDLFPDEVYVFTPRGDVRQFPKGATPIDFAFAIHTDVGLRCVGAKINGRLIPLRTELQNGDIVEVLTSPNHVPSKDWLKIVKTPRARSKLRQ